MDPELAFLVAASRRRDVIDAGKDPNSEEAQQWIWRYPLKRPKHTKPPVPNPPCSVYRCYGKVGDLLYVGITTAGPNRAKGHARHKEWWTEVTRQEWEHFATRSEAAEREKELIATLDPRYNIVRPSRYKRERFCVPLASRLI